MLQVLALSCERSDEGSNIDIDAFMSVSICLICCRTSSVECDVLHFTCTNVPSVSSSTVMYWLLGVLHATKDMMVATITLTRSLCSFKIDIFLYTHTTDKDSEIFQNCTIFTIKKYNSCEIWKNNALELTIISIQLNMDYCY